MDEVAGSSRVLDTGTRRAEHGTASIVFGPGQRNARLLIPLVQDTAFEDNEAFRVELLRDATEDGAEPEVFADTAIIIRDDDS
jgi:hypothetical protein